MTTKPPQKRYVLKVKLRKSVLDRPNFGELEVLTRSLGELWSATEQFAMGDGAGTEVPSDTPTNTERNQP